MKLIISILAWLILPSCLHSNKDRNRVIDKQSVQSESTCQKASWPNFQDTIFLNPEVPPDYPGGISAFRDIILNGVSFPLEQERPGSIKISFVIDEKGKAHSPVFDFPKDHLSNANEHRIRENFYEMKPWSPAICKGELVPTLFVFFVQF